MKKIESNNREELLSLLLEKVSKEYRKELYKAVELGKGIYKSEKRFSGNNVLIHALKTAIIVSELNLDFNSVLCAILHEIYRLKDGQEYNRFLVEVQEEFGEDVYQLLKTLKSISLMTKKQSEAGAINRYILKKTQDLRVLFIRLADRLHNSRTIEYLPIKKQKRLASKLLNIYSPLAEYLNLINFKIEFDNIAFKIRYPEEYKRIYEFIEDKNLDDNQIVNDVQDLLLESLEDDVKEPVIFGRIKGLYSIYKKQKKYANEGKPSRISDMNDILAFTIIVEDINMCYLSASSLIGDFELVEGSYEDYISNSKPNGFKEIQLSIRIKGIIDVNIEIQIMTLEMYHHNTYGQASHFAYKLAGKRYASPSDEFQWVKDVREQIKKSQSESVGKSHPMPSNIFQENVFVWTPDEEIINLPLGAKPLDFAYAIHTDIGNRAYRAKINGNFEAWDYNLQGGDIVEIITHPDKKYKYSVKRDWLQYVVTSRARNKIKQALRKKRELKN